MTRRPDHRAWHWCWYPRDRHASTRPATRKPLLIKLVLLLIPSLILALEPAYSENQKCLDVADMWLPSEALREATVVKWEKKDVTFSIISRSVDSATVKAIRDRLGLLSIQSGLRLSELANEALLPDFLVVVSPDIQSNAPLLRDIGQKLFQSKRVDQGRFQIDPRAWDQTLKTITPKCTSLDMRANGEITSAFVVIQENETSTCFDLGVVRSLGAIGIKKYYQEHNQSVSDAVVMTGLQQLYSEKIRVGMSRSEALEQLGEVCK